MSLNLPRIAAALNAYPWTPGCLTSRDLTDRERMVPTYCAIGAMLRYAGVTQDHIASAQGPNFWEQYGALLQSEYGIPDADTASRVMAANDTAHSQAEAIERVLSLLTGAIDFATLMRQASGMKATPAPEAAWTSEPEDDAGSLALV